MKPDLRTRAGREHEIRERVKKYRGFSSHWITEHPQRAASADRMAMRGELKTSPGRMPWVEAHLAKPKQ